MTKNQKDTLYTVAMAIPMMVCSGAYVVGAVGMALIFRPMYGQESVDRFISAVQRALDELE